MVRSPASAKVSSNESVSVRPQKVVVTWVSLSVLPKHARFSCVMIQLPYGTRHKVHELAYRPWNIGYGSWLGQYPRCRARESSSTVGTREGPVIGRRLCIVIASFKVTLVGSACDLPIQ